MTKHIIPRLSRSQRLSAVIAISSAFFVTEISLGFLTNSLALIADGFHYLSDIISYVVALTAIQVNEHGKLPPGFSFGWQRAPLLGAFFQAVFLGALGLCIFLQAIERFISLPEISQPKLILIVGAVGLALNILSVLIIQDYTEGDDQAPEHCDVESRAVLDEKPLPPLPGYHSHAGHLHTTRAPPSEARNQGMLGVLLHICGDAINNIGIMIAACIIAFTSSHSRYYADPAMSVLISLMIVGTAIPLLYSSGRVLLQCSATDIDARAVKEDLEAIPGVRGVHELHIWSLDERKRIASMHMVLDTSKVENEVDSFAAIAKTAGECLHAYGVHSWTIQPEVDEGRAFHGTATERTLADGLLKHSGEFEEIRLAEGPLGCQLRCGEGSCQELLCCTMHGH